MFSTIFSVLSALSVITFALAHVERATELVQPPSFGGVGAVQATTGDTRLYIQESDGSIREYSVSNAFDTGHAINSGFVLIPPGQAKLGTPIVATNTGGNIYREIHVYFFSPDDILSEWIWSLADGGWRGGPSCADCLTASRFAVRPGSRILYALQNQLTGSLRVGFVSANTPGTLTEADKSGGSWQLAPLPT